MNERRLFLYWLVSLILCFGIEYSVQSIEGIVGIGIIASIFLTIAFIHDFFIGSKIVGEKE